MHYTYKPLLGDGSITARAVSQEATDPRTKSGVMIKKSTPAGTNYAALMVTSANGMHLQSNFYSEQNSAPFTSPVWIRLTRAGAVVTASRSTDGITWVQIGAPVMLTLTSPATTGLFVNSHNGGALNTTLFDNVTVTP